MGRVFRCVQPVIFCVGMLLMVTGAMYAQDALPIPAPSAPNFGIPEDWSTQHVIYTRNGSVEDMLKVRDDPRFLNNILLHYIREHGHQTQPPASAGLNEAGLSENGFDADTQELPPQDPGEVGVLRSTTLTRKIHSKVDWAVSLGANGMAIGESPAKYTFNPIATPSCSDFIVFSTKGTPAVGSQANLVAFTNLYSGSSPTGLCGTAPTFLFSYAIGSGPSYLSPVLSLDGTKVAWIETSSANHAILHVTKWSIGQGTNATSGSVAIGSCPSAGSCDDAIDYTSTAPSTGCAATADSNTNSELYVDYPSDTGFIGADNGNLYHVKGIFNGTPTFDFCIAVNTAAGTGMSGPVYDPLLNEVFITDSKTLYAYTVNATSSTPSYALKASYVYGSGAANVYTGPGPVLDAFNGYIYVFSSDDKNADTSVTQLPVSLASAAIVPLGKASTNAYNILLYGAFDNNYYNYGPANALSTLYSCGADPTTTTAQDLYAISFNATTGVVNTTPAMSANKNVDPGTKNGTCSPITEFDDGTHDRIFVGMGQHAAATGANIVTMWDVTSARPTATTTPTASTNGSTQPYYGGTSGLIVDNSASGTAQAESVYFSTLYTGTIATCGTSASNYCAVKLTQGALQ